MKKILAILFISSFFGAQLALAKTHYLLIGGKDENNVQVNSLNDGLNLELTPTIYFLASTDYELHIVYGKRRPKIDSQLPYIYEQKRIDGSYENITSLIENYKKRINEGSINRNDQILVHIIDHGAPKNENEKEISHSIATINLGFDSYEVDSLSEEERTKLALMEDKTQISLDLLQDLIKLANKHGILMAIIDGSCYSGNTLKLANPNTCVISGSTEDTPSFGSFNSNLSFQFKAGENLESIYLNARNNRFSEGLPQISTEQGLYLRSLLNDFNYYVFDGEFAIKNINFQLNSGNYDSPALVLKNLEPLFSLLSENQFDQNFIEQLKDDTNDFKTDFTPIIQNRILDRKLSRIPYKPNGAYASISEWANRFAPLNAEYESLLKRFRYQSNLRKEKVIYNKLYMKNANEKTSNPCRDFIL